MTGGYVGVDLGTSGVKVVVLDDAGAVRGSASRTYPVHHPVPGAAEGVPEEWWRATREAVREALAAAGSPPVDGIGLDGQMHGLVLATGDGIPVGPALSWADTRAQDQLARWRDLPAELRSALGNPITPGMTGPLLCWVREHQPEALVAARWALLPKDWLRLRMTGEVATDPSDASATLLWDLARDRWAGDVVEALGLDASMLPPVLASGQAGGRLAGAPAAELGLPPGTPVATGAGDTAAALLASGVRPGQTQLTVGTGAQIVQPRSTPTAPATPVAHLYRAAEPHLWYAMAAVQNAGLALDWVRATVNATWDELYGCVDAGDPREPPTFVPYLTGERTPILDDAVRGAWVGLDLAHSREDILRSAAIGVACAIRHALESLEGPRPGDLLVAGGGTESPAMRQLLADTLQLTVRRLRVRHASPTGAAMLGAAACGQPVPPPSQAISDERTPGEAAAARERGYRRYRAAVDRLVAPPRRLDDAGAP